MIFPVTVLEEEYLMMMMEHTVIMKQLSLIKII